MNQKSFNVMIQKAIYVIKLFQYRDQIKVLLKGIFETV